MLAHPPTHCSKCKNIYKPPTTMVILLTHYNTCTSTHTNTHTHTHTHTLKVQCMCVHACMCVMLVCVSCVYMCHACMCVMRVCVSCVYVCHACVCVNHHPHMPVISHASCMCNILNIDVLADTQLQQHKSNMLVIRSYQL